MTSVADLPPSLVKLLAEIDGGDTFSEEFIRRLAGSGALSALVPAEYGGLALDYVRYGELHRAVAEVSPALQSLFTVHGMVCRAVARWGAAPLRREFLPGLADGTSTASFALTEQNAGSDIRRIETSAAAVAGGWVLDGHKKWITFGQTADVFLVFAMHESRALALLVRRSDPGVQIHPQPDLSGLRGARLAEVVLRDCRVPADRVIGRPGTGLTHVATDALTVGRLSVAHGAWGLARSALRAAVQRSLTRHQFDGPLHRLQLVRGLLADAAVAVESAEMLCRRAAEALDTRDEWAASHVLTAKLAASRASTAAAGVAAQIHGASGLLDGGAVDRYVRDARVMEIIEGNTQLIQHLIADQLLARNRYESHV